MDILTIGVILTGQAILATILGWWSLVLTRTTTTRLIQELQNLDSNLAEAIQAVTTMGGEGQNPLVGILSQVLQKNLDNTTYAEVIPAKDSQGKFTKTLEKLE